MSRERNNLKAGLFVVAGIVLTFIVVVSLAKFDEFFKETQTAEVSFALADGLKGLKVGASVTVAHMPAGQVVEIKEPVEHRPEIVVVFSVPKHYKIYENARVELDVPPLGSGTKLNIAGFGGDAAGQAGFHGKSWLYEAGDPPIAGGMAPSLLAADFVNKLGIEDQQRQQIKTIIANVEKLSAALAADVPAITSDLQKKLPGITDNANTITADLRTILNDVRGKYGKWLGDFEGILSGGKSAVDDGRQALGTVQAMLDENRPAIKATLADAAAIAEGFKSQTLEKVNTLLGKAHTAMDDVTQITGVTRTFITAQRPVLERAIANARLTSDQLKLAAIEVRRSPWRLLYTPTDKEIEADNIYDAARSFALAADSLNATADSLQAVMDRHGPHLKSDDSNLKLMLDNLHQTFEKFIEAEKKFWDAMKPQPR